MSGLAVFIYNYEQTLHGVPQAAASIDVDGTNPKSSELIIRVNLHEESTEGDKRCGGCVREDMINLTIDSNTCA